MLYGRGMTTNATLRVPGAALHYQMRGSGSVLLIVMGGGGDADAGRGIAVRLAERFTVVTYDRRDCPAAPSPIRTSTRAFPRTARTPTACSPR
jgi:pimeloyl-ACP methyl ester carboxylesterase